MTETDVQRPRADGGVRWRTALIAVGAALVPSALTLAIWLGTGESNNPEPAVLPEPNEQLLQIYLQSQLDPDECKADFAETLDEPSSERLPFYFC